MSLDFLFVLSWNNYHALAFTMEILTVNRDSVNDGSMNGLCEAEDEDTENR